VDHPMRQPQQPLFHGFQVDHKSLLNGVARYRVSLAVFRAQVPANSLRGDMFAPKKLALFIRFSVFRCYGSN
jgi:hypothetical protein